MRRIGLIVACSAAVLTCAGWRWVLTPPLPPALTAWTVQACYRGDVRTLALLNFLGVPFDNWKWPLLGFAGKNGQADAMEYLLAHGAPVNSRGLESALGMAIGAGNLEGTRWLLKHGAHVDRSGDQPLAHAIRVWAPDIVHLLLEHGAQMEPEAEAELLLARPRGCTRVEEIRELLRVHSAQAPGTSSSPP